MKPSEPTLGLSEAAKVCGVSVSTMRRRRDALVELGATRHGGSWAIPISALISLGLMPRVTPPESPSHNGLTPSMTGLTDGGVTPIDRSREASLTSEVESLRKRLADAEKRAAIAEAEARERLQTIEAQKMALRILEAVPHHANSSEFVEMRKEQALSTSHKASPTTHLSWWKRLTRSRHAQYLP